MSLTTRLSAFFLVGLAVVLAGFSLSIYLIADDYLESRERDRLQAAINMLRAMTEVDADGIEWEGAERGAKEYRGDVHWAIHDSDGKLHDHSPELGADDPICARIAELPEAGQTAPKLGSDRRGMRLTLKVDSIASPKKLSALTLTAAISTQPRQALLQRLAGALAGVSCVVWLLALVAGRWYCRRALRPVTAMADQAQAMRVEDNKERLVAAPTGDELAALGRSFNGLLDRLHVALERQRRFTGDASHQLRTPLAGLLGQVEIALRRERAPEEYRQTLEQVHEQGEQLRRIVEMLLFLARADAEARVEDFATFDLVDWLPEQLSRWDKHPRRHDLRIVSVGPCRVRAHGPLLGQLLDNLIDNALKYSERGTPVTIGLERVNAVVRLLVDDDGVGIRPDDLPRLFEPFYRSSEARSTERTGVGLGLSVAKRIAEVLGGSLTAEPRKRGSRFTLELPAALS